jgi:hypothetical protein
MEKRGNDLRAAVDRCAVGGNKVLLNLATQTRIGHERSGGFILIGGDQARVFLRPINILQ